MDRKITAVNRIFICTAFAMLGASLIYYLIKWGSLPENAGIHFGPDGEFDVYASRIYGFYPHLVGSIAIGTIAFVQRLISKKSTGLNIGEKGESIFKTELMLTLDIIAVLLSIFFVHWSVCVSHQHGISLNFVRVLTWGMFGFGLMGIIAEIITAVRHKQKDVPEKDTKVFRRTCRTAAWLLTALSGLFLFAAWERLPSGDLADEYHGLAYFGNFGAYLDKRLLMIPIAAAVIILAVLEIVSAKAVKKQDNALDRFTARLKLINGLFFCWWEFLFIYESKVGIISLSVYAVLTVLCTVLYIRKKKAQRLFT